MLRGITGGGGGAPGVNIPVNFPPGQGPSAFSQAKKEALELEAITERLRKNMAAIGNGGIQGPTAITPGTGNSPIEKMYQGIAKSAKEVEQSMAQQVRHARELNTLQTATSLAARAAGSGAPGSLGNAAIAAAANGGPVYGPHPRVGFMTPAQIAATQARYNATGSAADRVALVMAGVNPGPGPQLAALQASTAALAGGGGAAGSGLALGGGALAIAAGLAAIPAVNTPQGQRFLGNQYERFGGGVLDQFAPGGFTREYLNFGLPFGDWAASALGPLSGGALSPLLGSRASAAGVRRAEFGRSRLLESQRQFGIEADASASIDAQRRSLILNSRLNTSGLVNGGGVAGQEASLAIRQQSASTSLASARADLGRVGRSGTVPGTLLPGEDAYATRANALRQELQAMQDLSQLEQNRLVIQRQQLDTMQQQAQAARSQASQSYDSATSKAAAFLGARPSDRASALRALEKLKTGEPLSEKEALNPLLSRSDPRLQENIVRLATARGGGALFQGDLQVSDSLKASAAELSKTAQDVAKTFQSNVSDGLKDGFDEAGKSMKEGIPRIIAQWNHQIMANIEAQITNQLDSRGTFVNPRSGARSNQAE